MGAEKEIAKVCVKCGKPKSLTDFHRHKASKDGHQRLCKVCHHAANLAWLHENHARLRPKLKAYQAQYYLKNIGRFRVYTAKHYAENYAIYYEKMVYRQALKRHATPPWVDRKELLKIYRKAAKMRTSGKDVNVDHIVPLKHSRVCGLHVPWNLQIITASENRKKSNSFKEDQS